MEYAIKLKKQFIHMAILLGILILGLFALIYVMLIPNLKLYGKSDITINLEEPYQEPGYKANWLWKDITDKVKTTGSVDSKKIGDYHINYQLKYFGFTVNKKRNISVEDLENPVLTLQGNNPATICPNAKYEEEGVTALDSVDGDLTEKIKKREYSDKIIYSVVDKNGNRGTITRDLIREDKEAPTITLNSGDTIAIYQGETFVDPGYEVVDNCDKEVKVEVSGTVDANNVGSYQITYKSVDQKQNESIITRTVVVNPKPNNAGKMIYLTFDDGPSSSITPGILQILKEENVKATFFVINHGDNLNYLIKQEDMDGHTVALHSASHNYHSLYQSVDSFFYDFSLIQNKVYQITGKKSTIIRFPGGSSNTVSKFNPGIMTVLTKEVTKRGFTYFDWNVSSEDAGGARSASDVYRNVMNNLGSKINIVLMHDFEGNYKTLNALRDIIREGKRLGYTFAPITTSTSPIHHHVNN